MAIFIVDQNPFSTQMQGWTFISSSSQAARSQRCSHRTRRRILHQTPPEWFYHYPEEYTFYNRLLKETPESKHHQMLMSQAINPFYFFENAEIEDFCVKWGLNEDHSAVWSSCHEAHEDHVLNWGLFCKHLSLLERPVTLREGVNKRNGYLTVRLIVRRGGGGAPPPPPLYLKRL